MSAILDASSDLYFFVSRSGTIDYFNKAWEHSINQYCEVEVNPGMHLRDFLPFDRWEKWIPYIEKGLNGEEVLLEHLEKVSDVEYYFSLTGKPTWHKGEVVGCMFIVKNKSDEYRLKQERVQLTALITQIEDSVVHLDKNGIIRFWNSGAEVLFGIPAKIALGNSWSRIAPAASEFEEIKSHLQEVEAGKEVTREWKYPHPEGSHIWIHSRISPFNDHSGVFVGYLCTSREITETKQARIEQAENAARKKILLDSAPHLYALIDQKGIIQEVSKKARDYAKMVFGYDLKIGLSLFDSIIPEAKNWFRLAINQALSGVSTHTTQSFTQYGDDTIWLKLFFDPAIGQDGEIIGIAISAVNITQNKAIQSQLEEANQRFELASSAARIGIWDWDIEQDHTHWEKGMYEIYGGKSDEDHTPIDTWMSVIHPDDKEKSLQALEAILHSREQSNMTYRIIRPDGSLRHIRSLARIYRDSEGKPLRVIGIDFDQTDIFRAQQKMEQAKYLSDQMNILKSSLLGNISHEIRTPLNGILGLVQVLRMDEHRPETIQVLDWIQESGQRLMNTLTGLVHLAKLESDGSEFEVKPVRVNPVVSKRLSLIQKQISDKGLTLEYEPAAEDPVVMADQWILEQILNYLLDNALKFTLIGGIKVTTHLWGNQRKNFVQIDISDTGIGIKKNYIHRIIEPFVQESQGLGRDYEGVGLGLSIAYRYLQLLHGELKIISEKGKGSTFSILLPIFEKQDP